MRLTDEQTLHNDLQKWSAIRKAKERSRRAEFVYVLIALAAIIAVAGSAMALQSASQNPTGRAQGFNSPFPAPANKGTNANDV